MTKSLRSGSSVPDEHSKNVFCSTVASVTLFSERFQFWQKWPLIECICHLACQWRAPYQLHYSAICHKYRKNPRPRGLDHAGCSAVDKEHAIDRQGGQYTLSTAIFDQNWNRSEKRVTEVTVEQNTFLECSSGILDPDPNDFVNFKISIFDRFFFEIETARKRGLQKLQSNKLHF